jgi:putative hydrolase of the HAD superfamily
MHQALQNIAAVIFDVGGTLVHPDWRRLGKIVEAETRMLFTPPQMHEAFYAMLQAADAELVAGTNSARRSGAHWTFLATLRSLGVDEEACTRIRERLTATHQERHLWCEADAEASSVLLLLKSAGFRIGAISNTEDGRVNESLALADLASHFEFLIDSHHVGYSKPDKAIFQLAVDRLGLEPREAAYVGDSYGYDVIGAQRAGLVPILLDRSGAYEGVEFARIRSLSELVLPPER